MRPLTSIILLASLLLLGGCASNIPTAIRNAPPDNIPPKAVQQALDAHRGDQVRWGGVIVATRNLEQGSEILLMAQPLNRWGEPLTNTKSLGRFIAHIDGFIDPAEYAPKRKLTIFGQVSGVENRKIGDYPYDYPIVQVSQHHLWPIPVNGIRAPLFGWGLHDPFDRRDRIIVVPRPPKPAPSAD
jgi:outer membrane lipoprotein